MSRMRQIGAVTLLGLRSVRQRPGASFVIVISMAAVVGMLVTVLAMADGVRSTLLATGHANRAIVLSASADFEGGSSLPRDAVNTIRDAPGIMRSARGQALASAEVLLSVSVRKKSTGLVVGTTLRGVGPAAMEIRPEIHLIQGRAFRPGVRELMVGRAAQKLLSGLEVGDQLALRDGDWTVVGVFTSGDAHESELLTDAETLMSGFRVGKFNSLTVALDSAAAFETFRRALDSNPGLGVEAWREQTYFERQSRQISRQLRIVANVVGAIMAIGALFGALNIMYSAVRARNREIGTLRAIGYGPGGVVTATLAEAVFLSLLGAFLGAALAWFLFSGSTASTGASGGMSQTLFQMRISAQQIATGILWACAVGALGGLPPAIRAARLPVATVLRAA